MCRPSKSEQALADEGEILRAHSAPESKVRDVAAADSPPPADRHVQRTLSLGGLSRGKSSNRKSRLWRLCAEDPAKAQDVSTLMEALSTSHKGQQVVLSPETLKPPRMSTPGATLLPMWPRHTPPTNRQIASGLFSLGWYPDSPAPSTAKGYLGYMYSLPSALGGGHKGSETIVCSLTGAHTHLSGAGGATLQLSDTTALVMDSSCEGVTFSDLTFSGGIVVCHGPLCTPTFNNVTFERCTLVVLAGAHATLNGAHFMNMHACKAGLSIFVEGAGSTAVVRGGRMSGGLQGATVQSGGRVEAEDLSISDVCLTGVEAKDTSSTLQLERCSMHEFSRRHRSPTGSATPHVRAVHVHSGASAILSALTICGMLWGVHIRTGARATLTECRIADTEWESVLVSEGASCMLERCTLSGSKECHGLFVGGDGSCAVVDSCHLLYNAACGAVSYMRGVLTMNSCKSAGNKSSGFQVDTKGVMELMKCMSDGDYRGCVVMEGGVLNACMVAVHVAKNAGMHVCGDGVATLTRCTAKEFDGKVLHVQDSSSVVVAQDCDAFGVEGSEHQKLVQEPGAGKVHIRSATAHGKGTKKWYSDGEEPEGSGLSSMCGQSVVKGPGKMEAIKTSMTDSIEVQDCRLQKAAGDGELAPNGTAVLMQLSEYFSQLECGMTA